MRMSKKGVLGATLSLLVALSGSALALPPGIYITEQAQDPKSATFEKDLKKNHKPVIKKGDTGAWHVYFVAYLKKAAGTTELNIVFYDVTGGKKEQGNAYPVGTQPNAKIIMSDVELTAEQNFSAGHKYEVRITRLANGKEEIFATTHLELK